MQNTIELQVEGRTQCDVCATDKVWILGIDGPNAHDRIESAVAMQNDYVNQAHVGHVDKLKRQYRVVGTQHWKEYPNEQKSNTA